MKNIIQITSQFEDLLKKKKKKHINKLSNKHDKICKLCQNSKFYSHKRTSRKIFINFVYKKCF